MKKIIILIFSFFLLCLSFLACSDDDFSTNPANRLSFSTDTLSFDTLFSSVGSTTLAFKVYNKNNSPLKISQIHISGGESSPFRMNVDGTNANLLNNVEIRAKDSMFIFVEVTINPQDESLPFLVKDSIVFYTNTNYQSVKLIAYGQDAFVLKSRTIYNDTTLLGEKPYLIYGDLTVDDQKTLTIEKNCKLYFHNKANLVVKGNLVVNGTQDEPVVFRGDRLDYLLEDYKYDDLSGQWGGIRLLWNNGNHYINHAIIRNGKTGIEIKTADNDNIPNLLIENSIIHNFDSCGISSIQANVTIGNSIISNCAIHCLKFIGGTNRVAQSTIANYYLNLSVDYSRSNGSIYFSNYDLTDNGTPAYYALLQANFLNTIVYGSFVNEIVLDEDQLNSTVFNYYFSNCLLRMTEVQNEHYDQIIWNENPTFMSSKFPYDYRLSATSVARNIANLTIASEYIYDLNGNSRFVDTLPDLGAYEYVEE